MEIRNAQYNGQGTINCEIDHPKYGWIPFTASPDDSEQHGKDIYAELLAAGNIASYVAPVPSAVYLANQYKRDRQAAHISIADQLDMIYWDKINSTTIWLDYVTNIKTLIPKP